MQVILNSNQPMTASGALPARAEADAKTETDCFGERVSRVEAHLASER